MRCIKGRLDSLLITHTVMKLLDFHVETVHTLFVNLSLHYLQAQDGTTHTELYRYSDMLIIPTNTPLFVRWEKDKNCLQVQLSATVLKRVAEETLGKDSNRLRLVPTFQSRQQQLKVISILLLAEAQQKQASSRMYLDSLGKWAYRRKLAI